MATDETLRILTELGQQVSSLRKHVEKLETENADLRAENAELKAENKDLRERLHEQGQAKASKRPKFSKDYSVEHNQGKRKSKRGKQATGRPPSI